MTEQMEETPRASIGEDLLQPLLITSKTQKLEDALEVLLEESRTSGGRSYLASKNILPVILHLLEQVYHCSQPELLVSSLKLLRNLCAGEDKNQNLFIEHNGVGILLIMLRALADKSPVESGIIRFGLQVLANVILAGEKHQQIFWDTFFPDNLLVLTRVCSQDTIDPLCMIIYVCCDGCNTFFSKLQMGEGMQIVAEIVQTAANGGFWEQWFKLLISRICLEDSHLPTLFSKLFPVPNAEVGEWGGVKENVFSSEQAFLLAIVSEILNERLYEVFVSADFALFIFDVLKRSIAVIDFESRGQSSLPTGSSAIDVLGYSLAILRDLCAQEGQGHNESSQNPVEALLKSGILEYFLHLLRELEPPSTIRKAINFNSNQDPIHSSSLKVCPYKGYRRDIVAVISNIAYRKKHVQDEIRRKDGLLLLLRQCIIDEDNPFLKEWGIWAVRNVLEGNAENQLVMSELELQKPIDMPEIANLGLRVEMNPKTGRPRLVNC